MNTLLDNLILNTDSYKTSHWLQYPPQAQTSFFYVESRGGRWPSTLFFGLQAILKQLFARPVTHADVDIFVESIFNFPTLAEAYRVAALGVIDHRKKHCDSF